MIMCWNQPSELQLLCDVCEILTSGLVDNPGLHLGNLDWILTILLQALLKVKPLRQASLFRDSLLVCIPWLLLFL